MPRALKDWQAFEDLRKTIDDFNESCPLLELMANKAMKLRHWDRIAQLTGHTFDVESETFALRNIMEAPLLKYKEDIEVVSKHPLTLILYSLKRMSNDIVVLLMNQPIMAVFLPLSQLI